jgi:hypothetical protein
MGKVVAVESDKNKPGPKTIKYQLSTSFAD